jgi:hypothetical protein
MAVMTQAGAWLTITIVVTVGLLLGVVASWIEPPTWATPRRLAAVLTVVAAADVAVTYLQQTASVVPSAQDTSVTASASGLVTVDQIDAAQASRTILSVAGANSGQPRLVETSLSGAHRVVGPALVGDQFAVTGHGDIVVIAGTDSNPNAAGLAITTLAGRKIRALTFPPADATDSDPALTADGEVYFLRTVTIWAGSTGTPVSTRVMRVPLSGRGTAVDVPTAVAVSVASSSLSVTSAGDLLAASCVPPDGRGATEACVFALPSGRIRYVTHFGTSAPVIDAAISPDGRYLAYSNGAANAYGSSQIYVENLAAGSSAMVSRLPGVSQQPSWVLGSAAPCLLFSNSQTAGDATYLSCLSARSGTARVAVGANPEWLGTTLPAARPAASRIGWRALWRETRAPILLVGMFALGLLLGLLGGWFERPAWASRPRIAGLILGLFALQVGGALLPGLFVKPAGGLTTVGQLDPGQLGGVLVAVDAATGTGQLFAVRLDGSNLEAMQFYPGGSPFVAVGRDATTFVFNPDNAVPPNASIELVGPTGNVIRALSAPQPAMTDSSPAVAAHAQQVFFIRSDVVPAGPKATTVANSVVMRVPLTGGSARLVPVHASIKSGALSANADGTELAAGLRV